MKKLINFSLLLSVSTVVALSPVNSNNGIYYVDSLKSVSNFAKNKS